MATWKGRVRAMKRVLWIVGLALACVGLGRAEAATSPVGRGLATVDAMVAGCLQQEDLAVGYEGLYRKGEYRASGMYIASNEAVNVCMWEITHLPLVPRPSGFWGMSNSSPRARAAVARVAQAWEPVIGVASEIAYVVRLEAMGRNNGATLPSLERFLSRDRQSAEGVERAVRLRWHV